MTAPAPYYAEDGCSIYLGDAREIVPALLADGLKPGVVMTDPPYGINLDTDFHGRGMSRLAKARKYPKVRGDHEPFDPTWLLALNLPTLLWGANHYANRLPASAGWVVWDKLRPPDLDQSTAELAWSNWVKGVRVFRHQWNGMLRASADPIVHPTQKPEALHRWCFALRWMPPGIILDPYMGSGSLLRAAKDCGRMAVGIELERAYCDAAVERLQQRVLPLG